MKRVFFAINLPEEARRHIAGAVSKLQKMNSRRKVSWVSEPNFHVTLEFLGDQTDAQIEKAQKIARGIAAQASEFEMRTSDFGCFPNERAPKIVWLGMEKSAEALRLRKKLHDALLTAGFQADSKPWHAHITLGRVKDHGGRCDFGDAEPPSEFFYVRSFELMESELFPHGPQYSVLESFLFSIY